MALKAIIIELNGSGEAYGFKDADIHATLIGYGFRAMKYEPAKRQLAEISVSRSTIHYIFEIWHS